MNFNQYHDRFSFIKHRNKFFAVSILIIVVGLVSLLISGLNFGVDFKAGTSIDVATGKPVNKDQAQAMLKDAGVEAESLSIGGNNSDHISARFDVVLDDVTVQKVNAAAKAAFGDQVSLEVNTVSPDIARELGEKAIYAVLIASVMIAIYVSIRFEWRFALSAIITILHDAFIVICLFTILRLKVDLPFIAAVLTVIGYSINDKIVVFDRIRENLRFSKLRNQEDLSRMINDSIWQTMSRNINTVLTVLIAAVCLYIFGSESIKLFSFAMIIGLISGAFSSICVAAPLWYLFKRNSIDKKWNAAPAGTRK